MFSDKKITFNPIPFADKKQFSQKLKGKCTEMFYSIDILQISKSSLTSF